MRPENTTTYSSEASAAGQVTGTKKKRAHAGGSGGQVVRDSAMVHVPVSSANNATSKAIAGLLLHLRSGS